MPWHNASALHDASSTDSSRSLIQAFLLFVFIGKEKGVNNEEKREKMEIKCLAFIFKEPKLPSINYPPFSERDVTLRFPGESRVMTVRRRSGLWILGLAADENGSWKRFSKT